MSRSHLPGMPTRPPVRPADQVGHLIAEFTRLVGLPPFAFRGEGGHHEAIAILLRCLGGPRLAPKVCGLIDEDCRTRGLRYHWPDDAP